MSSPKEPGYPPAGERTPGVNGSGPAGDRTPGTETRVTEVPQGAHAGQSRGAEPAGADSRAGHEAGEPRTWQRGPDRGPSGPRSPEGAPTAEHPRGDGPRPTGAGAGAGTGAGGGAVGEARANRFPSSPTSAPASPDARPDTRPDTGEAPGRSEPAYTSELPDLSGPVPRPPHRKTGPDRPAGDPSLRNAPTTRLQVGHRPRGPVRASMQIRRVDPWSVLKVSLVLSVVLFFVWMIAVAFLYLVLGGMGVWSKLNSNVGDLLTSASGTTGGELVSSGTIFGGAALIGLVNIVLLSAMATIGAFVYNLTTDLVGGVEVTLADRD